MNESQRQGKYPGEDERKSQLCEDAAVHEAPLQ